MAKKSGARVHMLDEIRGLCIWLMVGHHLLYTLGYVFGVGWAVAAFDWLSIPAPFFAGLFVLICGMACHFSRNNLKRGALLALVAVGMTAVLYFVMPNSVIWFGVLHCLAVCILLYAALRKAIDAVPVWLGVPLCAVLFLFTWHLPADKGGVFGLPDVWTVAVPETIKAQTWLFPLGLGRGMSADYFPLFPWLFCFLAGALIGRKKFPAFMCRSRFPSLAKTGRYTLWIYLLHQPVIYGVCYLIFKVL